MVKDAALGTPPLPTHSPQVSAIERSGQPASKNTGRPTLADAFCRIRRIQPHSFRAVPVPAYTAGVRLHRELWLWLGGLFLTLFASFFAIAVSYFEKEPGYSLFWNPWLPLAVAWLAIAFAAFYAAANGRVFPPVASAGFPDIAVDVLSTGSTDTEREASNGLDVPAHLRSLHFRFTNAETERSARLSATMYVKLIAGSWGRAGEGVCPPPDWAVPSSLGLSPTSMPIELGPGAQATGHLLFEVPRYYLDRLASPPTARLEVLDHISGEQISIPAEIGHYPRSAMTVTRGGAEILGSEEPSAVTGPDQHVGSGLDQSG